MTKKKIEKKAAKKAANTNATPKKSAKAKQLKLPAEGMARERIPELDQAADDYRTARDVRMEHTKLEKAAKAKLLDVAKKHLGQAEIKRYVFEDEDGEELEVEYIEETDENVTVHKVKAEGGDE